MTLTLDEPMTRRLLESKSDDGGQRFYLAEGDAPADRCLMCQNPGQRQNLYDNGEPIYGPFCDERCMRQWMLP